MTRRAAMAEGRPRWAALEADRRFWAREVQLRPGSAGMRKMLRRTEAALRWAQAGLSVRAVRLRLRHGIASREAVAAAPDGDLLALRTCGPTLLAELRAWAPYAPPPPSMGAHPWWLLP